MRVETESARGEVVGVGWGVGDRGYLQVDFENAEPKVIRRNNNKTCEVQIKSESTQRSVCVSGGGSYNACFMMIGEFPKEVIQRAAPLNRLGLR